MSMLIFLSNVSMCSLFITTLFLIYDTLFSTIDFYYYIKAYVILSLIILSTIFLYIINNPKELKQNDFKKN